MSRAIRAYPKGTPGVRFGGRGLWYARIRLNPDFWNFEICRNHFAGYAVSVT